MPALDVPRSPLADCVKFLQHTAGPAAHAENALALAAKVRTGQSTIQACAGIILGDLALTLRVLRMANSVMFNLGGITVINVTHAAALMGTDALAQIVDTAPRHTLPRPARELTALCHLSAVIARKLMGRLEPRYAEEAFVSGLFRNIGELFYALERPDDYRKILAGSRGQMAGMRPACRAHARFDFDELSAGLLRNWSFHGAPVLATQSEPEALLAQTKGPEAEIALAASLGHIIMTASFRCDPRDREKAMRHGTGPLAAQFHVRGPQVEQLSEFALESVSALLARMGITREDLRLREWAPAEAVKAEAGPGVEGQTAVPAVETVLKSAIAKGVDRAAWLPCSGRTVTVSALAGRGWPADATELLPRLLPPRKPPYLLAFEQRQDVWIDFAKDDRFQESLLAATIRPAVFFLLPVCEGRAVRGCLYFDWISRRDFPPELLLPALFSLRDSFAKNMPVA